MAILSDKTIKEYLEEGKIVIDPLKDEQQIQPSSVDMRLGDEFILTQKMKKILQNTWNQVPFLKMKHL